MAQSGFLAIHMKKTELVGLFYDSVKLFCCILPVVYGVSFLRLRYKTFSEIPTVSGQTAILKSGIGCWKKKIHNKIKTKVKKKGIKVFLIAFFW